MTSDKLENIYQLLTEYDFNNNTNVPDNLKCGKCKKVMIKACQTLCGCRYCRSCIDEMIYNGHKFCPGITNNCKIESISTVQLDFRINNKISNLILECPEEMCSYECKLLEMSEHLRICKTTSMVCPFYKLGCDTKKMTNEKLIEHFQFENYNHNKTLIGIIDNIKNEIEELKYKELKNHEEINKLKIDLQYKDEKLKILNDEIAKFKSKNEEVIKSIKTDKDKFETRFDIGFRNIWDKIDEINNELNKACKTDKIESIKTDMIDKFKILQNTFNDKIHDLETLNKSEIKLINDGIGLEMKVMKEEFSKENEKVKINLENEINAKYKENIDKMYGVNNDIKLEMKVFKEAVDNTIMEMRIEQRINQLEIYIENRTSGLFEFLIDNANKLKNQSGMTFRSEYFYARMKPYKLRLGIWYCNENEFQIRLYICDDMWNQILSFPFKADVTMKVVNKNKQELFKSLSKYCQIDKPENDSFNWSDCFIYTYSELVENGILESNCFIVQCRVELKEL